jgi:hypothetical protein
MIKSSELETLALKSPHTRILPYFLYFLNVGGLKNKEGSKLEDPFFINKINKYDIVFLAETHIGYESNIHRVGTHVVLYET